VGNAPQFSEAVFAAQLKNQPEMVKIAQGYAVFQVTEIRPPATPGFEEIKARVEEDFKRERAMGMMGQKMQELADRARAAHNLKKAAAEVGATVKSSDVVSMSQQVPEVGSLTGPASVVFDMKPGEISAPISAGRNGVVLQLVDKQEPAAADFDKSKEEIREGLLAQKREQSLEMFAFTLRQQMEKQGKIRINKDEMKRLTPSAG
jgi:peptidyl-prolyl cis-trans isomerase D